MEAAKAWDFCTIVFRTYHNVGGGEHAGLNYGLLWFEAEAKGVNGRYQAGKSTEIPFGRISEGVPDRRNAAHLSVYQDLVNKLKQDGWRPISGGGAAWWEQRFRRNAREAPRSFLQKLRHLLSQRATRKSP